MLDAPYYKLAGHTSSMLLQFHAVLQGALAATTHQYS
jgi:hypothetical protein